MHILHVDGSPRQESHSRRLSAAIVNKLREVASGASITRRDLGLEPLPHTLASYAAALASPAILAAPPKGSLDAFEVLIQEVEAADVIVIGAPMYNYSARALVDAMERQKDWEPAVRPLQSYAQHDVAAAELAVDCQVEKR